MVIIGVSDLHGDISVLPSISAELSSADVVVVSGDITQFGDKDDAREMLNAFRPHCKNLLVVPGNCDQPDVCEYLDAADINLDGRITTLDGVTFFGLGGSLACPGRTPNETTEDTYAAVLQRLQARLEPGRPSVFVTHQPPFGTAADIVAQTRHVGSRAVRDFIASAQPALCLCGHIHEARATDYIGRTVVINPGPLRDGYFIRAQIDADLKSAQIIAANR